MVWATPPGESRGVFPSFHQAIPDHLAAKKLLARRRVPMFFSSSASFSDAPPAMMTTMMLASPVMCSSGGCFWRLNGPRKLFVGLWMALLLSCSVEEHLPTYVEGVNQYDVGCAIYGGMDGSSNGVYGCLEGCYKIEDICDGSDSFCFPSTLIGSFSQEDMRGMPSPGVPGDFIEAEGKESVVFEFPNGNTVSCSLMDSTGEVGHKDLDRDGGSSCKGSLVSDTWMEGLNHDERYEDGGDGLFVDSLSTPHVEINPSALDWGMKNMYSPSLETLSVTNMHDDRVLCVYEPFSSDPQFYAFDFNELCLAPGKAASLAFVFLPKALGSLSAHIILQTSFGGFIVHAKGIAIETPYRARPLVGLDISFGGRFSQNLSLYNPFDDVLYVEEVTAWVSFYSGSITEAWRITCSSDASHQLFNDVGSSSSGKNLLTVKSHQPRSFHLEIKPHRQWEVSPFEDETVAVLSLQPQMQGKVFGAVCMKLHNVISDISDTIIVPLEAEVHGKASYNALSGLVAAFVNSLAPCDGTGSVFALFIRSSASYLLSVLSIREVTEGLTLFRIKYMTGLLVYPGTVTQIALIGFNFPKESMDVPPKIPVVDSKCRLHVWTNDSAGPDITIPCQDLINACSRHEPDSSFDLSDGSYVGLGYPKWDAKLMNTKSGSLESTNKEFLPVKSKNFELPEADEMIIKNWKSQGTMTEMSVLKDHELLFPVVPIGSHFCKWITVHNPSQEPVVVQILLNSGSIIDQCKSSDGSYADALSKFNPFDAVGARYGFSFANSAITEAFVHPSGTALFGPIVFHPSRHCTWRSSALIRSNLSGVELLLLRAFGGSHPLVLLEGNEPIQKLEFRFDLSVVDNLSSIGTPYYLDFESNPCNHLQFKELYAKNTGELPLEVVKLEISGTECGLDGFRVETCKGFSLAPGESMRLVISYKADFSSAEVHRDLKLAMASGFIVIPMKASIPVSVFIACRKSFWKLVLKPIFIVLAAVFIILFALSVLPHAFLSVSPDYLVKDDNIIGTIACDRKSSHVQQYAGKARSMKENTKIATGSIDKHSPCQNGVQGNFERMQVKKEQEHPKKTALMQSALTQMNSGAVDHSDISGTRVSGHLTVHVARERGRRRKRRHAGSGLVAKFEASSSQSGNSTPSSPLSPNASTPKEIWPLPSDCSENPFSRGSVETSDEKKDEVPEPETSIKCHENTCLPSSQIQFHVKANSIGRPTLLPSATFPSVGWRRPGVATPSFLASTSPIAPHARAPGSNLSKEKTMKGVEDGLQEKEFTYDIWGNHFSDHLAGRPKLSFSMFSDASEGDSLSFFARGPQSLMMMSSAYSETQGQKLSQPICPGPEIASNDKSIKCPSRCASLKSCWKILWYGSPCSSDFLAIWSQAVI